MALILADTEPSAEIRQHCKEVLAAVFQDTLMDLAAMSLIVLSLRRRPHAG